MKISFFFVHSSRYTVKIRRSNRGGGGGQKRPSAALERADRKAIRHLEFRALKTQLLEISNQDKIRVIHPPFMYLCDFSFMLNSLLQAVSCIWVLTSRKNGISYNKVWGFVKQEFPKIKPTMVTCDFEKAHIKSLRHSFPGVNVRGCYFHFCPVYSSYKAILFLLLWQ